MGFDVKDKVALVTGANRGIGKAILDSLIAHGASKVYAAIRTIDTAKPLVEKYGVKVKPVQVNLEQPKTIIETAKTASDVQLVVNNAGVLKISSLLDGDAIDNLQYELNINVMGLIHMARAFAPILKNNGGGAFVQLNSVASIKSFPDFATYSATKAAAYSITQALRYKLAEQGTLVVSVHPGPIATDMVNDLGFDDVSEPPEVVAEGLINALETGEFHVFPDSIAKQVGEQYSNFAKNIIEANFMEGESQ